MTDVSTGTTTWAIDPSHSVLEFAVTHMMFTTAKGRFLDFDGTIFFDERDPGRSRVEVIIRTGSIDTGNRDRDTHLRSSDFFDTERYPTATFRSTRIEPRDGDILAIHGNLAIKGMTRAVVLETAFQGMGTIPGGPEVVGFQATTTLKRSDFGLNWNVPLEGGGMLVSDGVRLTLDIQAARTDEQESPRTGPTEAASVPGVNVEGSAAVRSYGPRRVGVWDNSESDIESRERHWCRSECASPA